MRQEIRDALSYAVDNGGCARRKIGAVLTNKEYRILAAASNGPLVGSCNCKGKDVPAGAGSAECYSMHAEQKALIRCDPSEVWAVFCNKAPCTSCVLVLLGTNCMEINFVTASNETRNQELWEAAGRIWRQME